MICGKNYPTTVYNVNKAVVIIYNKQLFYKKNSLGERMH